MNNVPGIAMLLGGLSLLWLNILMMPPSRADEVKTDLRLLTPVSLELPVRDRLSVVLNVSPRVADNIGRWDKIEFGPTLQYDVSPAVNVQVGYNYTHPFAQASPDEHEIYEQVGFSKAFKYFRLNHRLGMTQTMQERSGGAEVAANYRILAEVPIKNSQWRLLGSNQIEFALARPGPPREAGFNENRTFVGLGRCFTPNVCTRAGYILEFERGWGQSAHELNHIFMVGVNASLGAPVLFERIINFD